MSQKLSAMKYIKNNKRRVSVLIVSLTLCFVLVYLTQFLLSSTETTYSSILLDNPKKIQYLDLAASSLGIDVDNVSSEEIVDQYREKSLKLMNELKKNDRIRNVFYAPVVYVKIQGIVGWSGTEIPLVRREEIPELLEAFDARVIEGRLPKKAGEVVVNKGTMLNQHFEIGGNFMEEYYEDQYTVVGVLDCPEYFGCGIPLETDNQNQLNSIVVLSDIEDMTEVLNEQGLSLRKNFDTVLDVKTMKQTLKKEVVDVIGSSTKYIYLGITILLFLAMLVVYTSYLRDRHKEWCLYCSIGFSRKEIYFAIMRELLFTFGFALLVGIVIIAASVVLLDYAMIKPQGLLCIYFQPKTLGEILCTYMLLIGALQLPVRYAIYRIRTIDAIDDDL